VDSCFSLKYHADLDFGQLAGHTTRSGGFCGIAVPAAAKGLNFIEFLPIPLMEGGVMANFERRVLVLDSRYEPVKIVGLHVGFVLLFTERASPVLDSPRLIRSVTQSFTVPWIIRQHNCSPRNKKSHGPRFSRQNVYLRDGFRCQYCNCSGSLLNLTLDHLIPLARGGKTSWDNIVTACKTCNLRKGARTIEELGIRLPRMPERPQFNTTALFALRYGLTSRNIPEPWLGYVDLSVSNRLLDVRQLASGDEIAQNGALFAGPLPAVG
jgi:5-methylcytosine-specific restriction endonuclease McrA